MSKVITFSRVFPSHHPKVGQPTFFVEKMCNSLLMCGYSIYTEDTPVDFLKSLSKDLFNPKHHTIRSGKRWKVGDKFSPRVWSGKPYQSKQIIIGPDIELTNVIDFCIDPLGGEYRSKGKKLSYDTLTEIAKNDGFDDLADFELWFKVDKHYGFIGQIICWKKDIQYYK